jgi:hypothetical protein
METFISDDSLESQFKSISQIVKFFPHFWTAIESMICLIYSKALILITHINSLFRTSSYINFVRNAIFDMGSFIYDVHMEVWIFCDLTKEILWKSKFKISKFSIIYGRHLWTTPIQSIFSSWIAILWVCLDLIQQCYLRSVHRNFILFVLKTINAN